MTVVTILDLLGDREIRISHVINQKSAPFQGEKKVKSQDYEHYPLKMVPGMIAMLFMCKAFSLESFPTSHLEILLNSMFKVWRPQAAVRRTCTTLSAALFTRCCATLLLNKDLDLTTTATLDPLNYWK